jgi:hypothetical protein
VPTIVGPTYAGSVTVSVGLDTADGDVRTSHDVARILLQCVPTAVTVEPSPPDAVVETDAGEAANFNRIGETMHVHDERTWEVRVPITVTADDREQAIEFALDDLRDPTMQWDTFEVKQTGGPHKKIAHGRCDVCGHYGDDCEGTPDD